MTARCVPPALLALMVLFSSCRKPAVESYRIPKETAAQAPTPAADKAPAPSAGPAPAASGTPAGNAMANTAVATASGASLTWTAPAHWQSKQGSAMRKGTYVMSSPGTAGEAELAITAFPGDVGGELANVNRWRGQIQLPPIAASELATATQHLDRNDLHLTVVDIVSTGASPQRILGAMVPFGGNTWFFKLMGPDAIVAKEKAAFISFLDSIKPAAAK